MALHRFFHATSTLPNQWKFTYISIRAQFLIFYNLILPSHLETQGFIAVCVVYLKISGLNIWLINLSLICSVVAIRPSKASSNPRSLFFSHTPKSISQMKREWTEARKAINFPSILINAFNGDLITEAHTKHEEWRFMFADTPVGCALARVVKGSVFLIT